MRRERQDLSPGANDARRRKWPSHWDSVRVSNRAALAVCAQTESSMCRGSVAVGRARLGIDPPIQTSSGSALALRVCIRDSKLARQFRMKLLVGISAPFPGRAHVNSMFRVCSRHREESLNYDDRIDFGQAPVMKEGNRVIERWSGRKGTQSCDRLPNFSRRLHIVTSEPSPEKADGRWKIARSWNFAPHSEFGFREATQCGTPAFSFTVSPSQHPSVRGPSR